METSNGNRAGPRPPAAAAKALFLDALERPRRERAGFARRACGGDPVLLGRVLALLEAHAEAESALALRHLRPRRGDG